MEKWKTRSIANNYKKSAHWNLPIESYERWLLRLFYLGWIVTHLFFNFFRIFCAQHQIRFLIVCNSFQPALYMVTEILEIIYMLFLNVFFSRGYGADAHITTTQKEAFIWHAKSIKSMISLYRLSVLITSFTGLRFGVWATPSLSNLFFSQWMR